MNDVYDISQYTDEDLYEMIDMSPTSTDREVEAKIIHLARQYLGFDNEEGRRIVSFYEKMYRRLFMHDGDDDDDNGHGHGTSTSSSTREGFSANVSSSQPTSSSQDKGAVFTEVNNLGTSTRTLSNTISTTTDYRKTDTLLTKPLDYAKDQLNPLLTQTIKRIISIDSQYRENKGNTLCTDFTFNLSEPLRDVVSLKLYSVSIPYSWYTISNAFGANFFYIKGNVPGMDTGAHDYKIAVRPGNYDAPSLALALNQGIASMMALNTDVYFGDAATTMAANTLTKVVYNNNFSSNTNGTGKSHIEINLRKIFNEQSYRIEFPEGSGPLANAPLSTLGGYLGMFQAQWDTTTHSHWIPASSILSTSFSWELGQPYQRPIAAPASNIILKIRPYLATTTTNYTNSLFGTVSSSNYLVDSATTQSLEAIITLPVIQGNLYPRQEWINLLDTALRTDTSGKLDTAYCGAEWIAEVQCVQMRVKWNPRTYPYAVTSSMHQKCVVIFPYDVDDPILKSVWTMDETLPTNQRYLSVFGFSMNRGLLEQSISDNVSPVHYPYLETSILVGSTPVYKSRFDLESTNVIQLTCELHGYQQDGLNDYSFSVAAPSNGYRLSKLLKAINDAITAESEANDNELIDADAIHNDKQTRVYQNPVSTGPIYFKTFVQKTFTNTHYRLVTHGYMINLFGGNQNPVAINTNTTFNGFSSHQFDGNVDYVEIIPLTDKDNRHADPFVIRFQTDTAINNFSTLINFVQTTFQSFLIQNRYPMVNTTFTGTSVDNGDGTFSTVYTLHLPISFVLTYKDFSLDFSLATDIRDHFLFDQTVYDLELLVSTNVIVGTGAVPSNTLTVFRNDADVSNAVMRLVPYSSVAGLQTTTDERYIYTISIPIGEYNITEIYEKINFLWSSATSSTTGLSVKGLANAYDAATYHPLTGLSTKLTFSRMDLDINQLFLTKDFRVVFYDPFSFATCTSSGSLNKKIQNVSWDTTIGYILGFRNNILYYLVDYVDYVDDGGQTLNYYGVPATPATTTTPATVDTSNVCYMIGDTVTNTNLYNYFMIILDDYVQNHVNDGLVKITNQETRLQPEPYIMVCNPATGRLIPRPLEYGSPGITYTEKELAAFQEKVSSMQTKINSYSRGPFVKDIFGYIPLKPGNIGSVYTEFGGTLQNQDRVYFGPVNIHRMTIRMLNDRGDLVDTNNVDWNFSLICEQLYRNSNSTTK